MCLEHQRLGYKINALWVHLTRLGIKETNFGESHEQMCESSLFLSGFPPSNKNHGEIGPKIDQVCPPSIEEATQVGVNADVCLCPTFFTAPQEFLDHFQCSLPYVWLLFYKMIYKMHLF